MKKMILIAGLVSTIGLEGQILAIGTKYSTPDDFSVNANFNFPYNPDNAGEELDEGLFFGADYSLSLNNSDESFRGLKLTPLAYQKKIISSDQNRIDIYLGAESSYLFNSGKGKDGVVLSPYVKILSGKNHLFSLKTGYEYNTSDGNNQVFAQLNIDLFAVFLESLDMKF